MPYMSRKRRGRMAAMAPSETMSEGMRETPESETPAEETSETPETEAAEPESKEQVSAYVPMSFFGGKVVKPGDTEPVKILAVDPEADEVEIKCEKYGGERRSKSMMDMMDEEVPEEA